MSLLLLLACEEAPAPDTCSPPVAELSTSVLDLGLVESEGSGMVWVRNNGGRPLGIWEVQIWESGVSPELWSAEVEGQWPWVVPAGESLPILVRVSTGGEGGPTLAALLIGTGDIEGEAWADRRNAIMQVLLSATRPEPGELLVEPGFLDFGSVSVATTLGFEVENVGSRPISFGLDMKGCPADLALTTDPTAGSEMVLDAGVRVRAELTYTPLTSKPLRCTVDLGEARLGVKGNDSGPPDSDDDGYPESLDCDDLDPDRNPGETEVCDGADNDCNGEVDDKCIAIGSWEPEIIGRVFASPFGVLPGESTQLELWTYDHDEDVVGSTWTVDEGDLQSLSTERSGGLVHETLSWSFPPDQPGDRSLTAQVVVEDSHGYQAWADAGVTLWEQASLEACE